MVRRLESINGFNNFTHVVLDLSDVSAIDGTAALAVEDMLRMVQAHRQNLYFVGIKPAVLKVLEGLGVLDHIGPEQRYDLRLDALRHADQGNKFSPTDELSGAQPT
ncbi:MAG: sodium-independent anion transporter [Nitrospirales bacterium]|nr:sodium-independent anion transporter [Nitrospirales bacterium]